MGWNFMYVSDRHSHSNGPKRKRASHQGAHSSWRRSIATTLAS